MPEPFSFQALGTTWWVEVWDEVDEETASKIKDFAGRFCQTFSDRYSRFDPNSQISRLNTDRMLASPRLGTRQLLITGIDLYRRTRGVFNILTGHILEARGYDGAYSFVDKGSAALEPGNPLTDLKIEEHRIDLAYGNVDLGGYGKGYCIDALTVALRDQFGLEQFLINGGGDIYATHKDGEAVEVHLQDPLTKQLTGSTLLKNRAFASSSPHLRSWPTQGGPDQHHIVSSQPRPQSVQGLALHTLKDAVYLTAPTATEADAFATTLLQVDDDISQNLAAENSLTIL